MPQETRNILRTLDAFHFEHDQDVFDDDPNDDVGPIAHLIVPQHAASRQRRRSLKARVSFSVPKDSEQVLLESDYSKVPSVHRTVDDFKHVTLLGVGSYGQVYLVKDQYTGKLFAKKTIKKARLSVDKKSLKNSRNERDILAKISNHPSIVKLFYTFHDHEDINFILEYIPGGEIFHHLQQAPGFCFSESHAAFYLSQIADALHHLHTLGVVYRDLKPENCLLDAEGHVILTDFGLSSTEETCNSILGTPEFTAPEVLQGQEYSYQADWWSFGVMMYDMLVGSTPFKGGNKKTICDKIMKKKVPLDQRFLSEYSKGLLRRLLNKNPEKRLNVDKDFTKFQQDRFFRNINWKDLRQNTPPLVPNITDPELAENFDLELAQHDESALKNRIARKTRESMDARALEIPDTGPQFDDSMFKGFSYTAEQSFLEKHIMNS